jgi:hypothetical protein
MAARRRPDRRAAKNRRGADVPNVGTGGKRINSFFHFPFSRTDQPGRSGMPNKPATKSAKKPVKKLAPKSARKPAAKAAGKPAKKVPTQPAKRSARAAIDKSMAVALQATGLGQLKPIRPTRRTAVPPGPGAS